MFKALILAATLSINLPLAALETAQPLPTATPTPDHFEFSQVPVTPDASFNYDNFKYKWPHISLQEAQRLHGRKDTLFVDGRSYNEWKQAHIPGAVPLPIGEFEKYYDKYRSKLKKAKILVSYCHGETCRLSDHLAQLLVNKGHRNVAVFWGGYPAWTGAHLALADGNGKLLPTPAPTATPKPPIPTPQP
jgi:rhodanese-related sulfurtransferase